jgi:hypothetical protein
MGGRRFKMFVQTFSGNKRPFLASFKLLVETDWLLSVLSNQPLELPYQTFSGNNFKEIVLSNF